MHHVRGHYKYQYTTPRARQYLGKGQWAHANTAAVDIGAGSVVAKVAIAIAHDIPSAYDLEMQVSNGVHEETAGRWRGAQGGWCM
jgi:hypothetical protein